MSTGKRIGIILVLLFVFSILFVLSCTLVMFLAPGTEIFGVRYVSAFVGNYEKDVSIESFSGDVYIETQNVPITIEFVDYYATNLSFHQNFTGFTQTKINQAGVDYYVENGDLKIKTTEFIKFIYANEDYDNFHFVLRLPAYAFNASQRSINITAGQSPVKFVGSPKLKNLNISTSGVISVDGNVSVYNDFILKIGKSTEIGDSFNLTNLDVTTRGDAYVNITKAISGDLKVNTRGGDVMFISCNNLYAETVSGSIRGTGTNGAVVDYNVNIKTRSGSVELAEANKMYQARVCKSTIETKSGKVNITNAYDIDVVSDSGNVFIGNANNVNITNRIGLVEVKESNGNLYINNANGASVAGENGALKNVKIESNSGVIKVYNTKGTVDLKSNYNSVTFKNQTSSRIYLYAGKKLVAENLFGEVTAYATENVSMKFSQITANISVEVGNKAKVVDIDATCSKIGTVSYVLRSTKGERAKLYAGDDLIADNSTISNVQSGQYLINVKTVYARTSLYFSA